MADRGVHSDSLVVQFYHDKTVFLTGCTGCVGKVLLEKLIYACRSVKCVYVLIREKRGVSGTERIEQLINSPVFSGPNRIPQNVLRAKIVPIYGDLTADGLGLSDQDRFILVNEVEIILHCAASVHFDDPVKEALKINYLGTKAIADLCPDMKRLQAFVHVSTCYSNCHLDEVEEKVYPTKMAPERLMAMSALVSSDELDRYAKKHLYEGRPNSYVFSKAVTENYVAHKGAGLPVSIARLPIVLPALLEPEPGFVDTAGAGNFVGLTCGIGAIRTYDFDPDIVQDYQGVDTAADAILVIAMDTAMNRQDSVKVFNVALGADYKFTFGSVLDIMNQSYSDDLMTFKAFRPKINISKRPSRLAFLYRKYILEYFYALFFDVILLCMGHKSFALRKTMFVSSVREALDPFVKKTFIFKNDNFRKLNSLLNEQDKQMFRIDLDKLLAYLGSNEGYLELLRNSGKSYSKNKFNDPFTPESVPLREAHCRRLRMQEVVAAIVIHSVLASMFYLVYAGISAMVNIIF